MVNRESGLHSHPWGVMCALLIGGLMLPSTGAAGPRSYSSSPAGPRPLEDVLLDAGYIVSPPGAAFAVGHLVAVDRDRPTQVDLFLADCIESLTTFEDARLSYSSELEKGVAVKAGWLGVAGASGGASSSTVTHFRDVRVESAAVAIFGDPGARTPGCQLHIERWFSSDNPKQRSHDLAWVSAVVRAQVHIESTVAAAVGGDANQGALNASVAAAGASTDRASSDGQAVVLGWKPQIVTGPATSPHPRGDEVRADSSGPGETERQTAWSSAPSADVEDLTALRSSQEKPPVGQPMTCVAATVVDEAPKYLPHRQVFMPVWLAHTRRAAWLNEKGQGIAVDARGFIVQGELGDDELRAATRAAAEKQVAANIRGTNYSPSLPHPALDAGGWSFVTSRPVRYQHEDGSQVLLDVLIGVAAREATYNVVFDGSEILVTFERFTNSGYKVQTYKVDRACLDQHRSQPK